MMKPEKMYRDAEFDIQDLSLQIFSPDLKNVRFEDTQYLNILNQVDFSEEEFFKFEFGQKFQQPYSKGGRSEFLSLVNFMSDHPEMFKDVLSRIFSG